MRHHFRPFDIARRLLVVLALFLACAAPAFAAAPPTPTGVTAVCNGSQSVLVSWGTSTGATNYIVMRSTTSGGETALATVGVVLNYTDTTVTNGTKYFYKIEAKNSSGTSSPSTEVSAIPIANPAGLAATPGNAQAALTWTTVSGTGVTYNVYRGTTSGGESTTAVTTGLTTAAYTNTGLTNGTTYFYEIKAVSGGYTSPYSNEASTIPFTAPIGVVATPGSSQVVISWTADTGAAGYNVYRGTTTGQESTTALNSSPTTSTSYTDSTAVNGTKYFYTVKGESGTFLTVASTEVSAIPITPPSGLAATPGNVQATLTWTAVSGTGVTYNVYRGTTAGGESGTAIVTGLTSPSYTNTGLTNGIKYYFTVKDVVNSNTSPASNEASTTPFTAPVGVTATPGNAQVAISWTSDTGAAGYYIYRGTSTGGESTTPLNSSPTTTTSYTDSTAANGTKYYYKVSAESTTYTSSESSEVSATPVATPSGLAATAGATQVALTWTAVSGTGVTYNVYRGTTSGGESSTAIVTGLTSATYTNTGLTNGTAYFYEVKALSGSYTSPYSNEASATPLGAPSSLAATINSSSVALTWSANSSGGSGYFVYRGTTSNGESGTALNSTAVTTTSYTDSTAVNGTTYYYKVEATKNSVNGPASNEAVGEPLAVPSGLTAQALVSAVKLTWTIGAGDTSVNIYRGTTSGQESTTAIASGVQSPYTDTGVTNGTKYYYKVKGVNATGTGGTYSNEANATPEPLPAQPTGLAITTFSNYLVLNWNSVTGANTYNVYRSTTSGGEGSTPYATSVSGTNYVDRTLTPGATYYYEVSAVGPSGEGPKSAEASGVAPTPPPAPTGLTLGTVTDTTAAFSWNSVAQATGYQVPGSLVSGEEDTNTVFEVGPDGTATATTASSLTTNTTYYAVVEAQGPNGTFSTHSNEVSFTTLLSTPTNLTATITNGQVTLNWTASTGATGYTIQRNVNGAGETSVGTTNTTSFTDTTLNINTLPPGSTTEYYVDATTSTNHDPRSATIYVQTPSSPPTGLSATGGVGSVSLTWSVTSGGTGFNVLRSLTSGGPYTQVGTTVWSNYTDTGLTNNTTYFYVVVSTYLGGSSAYSNQASATTAPAAPATLTATSGPHKSNLTWASTAGAVSYNIYHSTVTGGPYGLAGSATGTTFTDITQPDNTTYYFVVTAVNSTSVESAYSPEATDTTPPAAPTGVAATTSSNSVTLSWNASTTGATGYNVYRGTIDQGPYTKVNTSSITATTYTDTTAANGTIYYYVVTATDANGESAYSEQVTAEPGMNGAPIYQINSGGSAVGTWSADEFMTAQASATTTGNTIDLSHVQNPAPEAVYQSSDVSIFPITYAIPGLTPNAPYTVRLHFADWNSGAAGEQVMTITIQGVEVSNNYDPFLIAGRNAATIAQFNTNADGSGNIAISIGQVANDPMINGVEIWTGSAVPTAPFNLHALPGHAQVVLGWSGFAGLTGYNVYRSLTTGGPYTLLTSTPVVAATYTDTTAANGTTYYYVVTSVNSVGESTRSNEVYATPLPVNASVYRIDCGGPAVGNWSADEFDLGLAGSVPYTASTAPILTWVFDPAPATVYQEGRASGNYVLPYLIPGNNYAVRLHFCDFLGTVAYPDQQTITINGVPVLTLFDALSETGGTNIGIVEQFNTTADTNGDVTILETHAPYFSCIDGIELLTDSLPPSAPSHVYAWRGNTQVGIAWHAIYGAATYNVYRSTSSTGPYTQIANGLISPSYSDPTTANDYYEITSVNSTGESAFSEPAYPVLPFTLSATSGAISSGHPGSVSTGIIASSNQDFAGTIAFTGTALPGGVIGLIYPLSSTLAAPVLPEATITTGTTIQFCIDSSPTLGTFPVTITGTSGDYSASAIVSLTVN